MKVQCYVVAFTGLLASSYALKDMTDIKSYPPCLLDDDCKSIHKLDGFVCFQYFCYPWEKKPREAGAKPLPLELCRYKKDCGVNFSGSCFRHYDKRRIHNGICIESEDRCVNHEECNGKGGKCCNGYCCNGNYFDAIKDFTCVSDIGCQDLLTGSHCCIDVMGATKSPTNPHWDKKCCSNERGPVVTIPKDLSPVDKQKVDQQIARMGVVSKSICESMEYEQSLGYKSCVSYTTTTTTTTAPTTTTREPTTPRPRNEPVSKGSTVQSTSIWIDRMMIVMAYFFL